MSIHLTIHSADVMAVRDMIAEQVVADAEHLHELLFADPRCEVRQACDRLLSVSRVLRQLQAQTVPVDVDPGDLVPPAPDRS